MNKEYKQEPIMRSPMGDYIRIYFYGMISSNSEEYIERIAAIREANEGDIVRIYLNTEGGDAYTALSIIKAMNESNGHIITVVDGQCSSAGTLIFLAGDEYEVGPDCSFMVHNYSSGLFGKGHELVAELTFKKQWFEKIIRRFYKDFLTESEIEQVIGGKDLWMDAEEVAIRCMTLLENKNFQVDEEAE